MPRIRTLKPEALTHRKVGRLTDRTFRLWIGCITQADDEGRLAADPEQLRVLIFGYHPRVTVPQVVQSLRELVGTGLIRLYGASGNLYAAFPSWGDHQRPNRPTRSTLPAPTTENTMGDADFDGFLATWHEGLTESSLSPHGGLTEDSRGKGRERKGTEGKGRGSGGNQTHDRSVTTPADAGLPGFVRTLPFPSLPPEWWRRTLACFPGLDHEAVLRDAAAYYQDHRAKYRDVGRFVRNQLARAFQRQREQASGEHPHWDLPVYSDADVDTEGQLRPEAEARESARIAAEKARRRKQYDD